jgi:hypothetical protein
VISAFDRRPWISLWLRELERAIPGPWCREISLAIDRTILLLESAT